MIESLRIFLTLSDAVIITDSNHCIVDVNPAYESITGYKRDMIVGAKASIVKTQHTSDATYKSMYAALNQGESWSGIFINKKAGGSLWHSSISITPYVINEEIFYVGIFRELEHLEEGIYIAEERKNNIQGVLLKVLAISCEIRDPATEDHLTRVRDYTERLVYRHNKRMKLRLSGKYMQSVVSASIMHDIGKSGVPEGILYKPGPLTSYERLIVEMHPLIGVDILEKINSELQDSFFKEHLSVARNIIKHHHEKWDGTGYPSKLEGTAIPLEARIVSVVDVYDALTSRRPYKETWSKEKALDFLRDNRGTLFDPDIVDSFLSLFETEYTNNGTEHVRTAAAHEPEPTPSSMEQAQAPETKLCSLCKVQKPLSEFLRRRGRRSGKTARRGTCRTCRQTSKEQGSVEEHEERHEPDSEATEAAAAVQGDFFEHQPAIFPKQRLNRPLPELPPRPKGPDASVLRPTGEGIILMRGKTDKGRRWHQETDLETAITLVKEHAAVVVNPHTIRRVYSNKSFRDYILKRDRNLCHFCGEYGDTIDHLLPRAKGGHTTPANCVCACNVCNQSKAARSLDEFVGEARTEAGANEETPVIH